MKKKALIIILVISLVFSSGCWDYTEYEQMALVSAMGVDYDKNTKQITISLLYLIPGGGSQGKESGSSKMSSTLIEATGLTVMAANTKIQEATGKKLFFGYMDDLILGKTAAENITEDVLAMIDRSPSIRTTTFLAVADGNAADVLNTYDPDQSSSTGKHIHDMIEQSQNSGSASPVSIQDFLEYMANEGVQPTAPEISVTKTENGGSSSSSSSGSTSGSSSSSTSGSSSSSSSGSTSGSSFGSSSGSTSGSSSGSSSSGSTFQSPTKPPVKKGYFRVDGMAAFKKDKLVGFLNYKDSLGLMYVTNKTIFPYVAIVTTAGNDPQKTLCFRISKSKSKIKINIQGEKPVINIDTYIESDLRKYAVNIKPDQLTPDTVSILEKKLSDNVKKEMDTSISKCQKELKTDILGIGFEFYRQHPTLWKEKYKSKWMDMFQSVTINVNVNTKIINTGTTVGKFTLR